ncbi:MAG TPA: hypothetical protein VH765_04785 [Xanthobacteraceae bacterium]
MRTLYALLFVCFSLQANAFDFGASACDFDAMNAATTVDSYEYTAATVQPAIPSEDEYTSAATQPAIPSEDAPLDSTIEYGLVGDEWIADATASIPEISYDEGLNAYGDPFFAY